MGIRNDRGRQHRRRRHNRQLGQDVPELHATRQGPPLSRWVEAPERRDTAGLVVVGLVGALFLYGVIAGIAGRDAVWPELAALAYLLINAWAVALAVIAEHPRRSLIIWLTVPALLGLFPFMIATCVILVRDRPAGRGPWGARVAAAAAGPCAPHNLLGCPTCGPDAGDRLDYLTTALADLDAAQGILTELAYKRGYPDGRMATQAEAHVDAARELLVRMAHLPGSYPPPPANT